LSHLLTLFTNNILPIFLAAGAGFLLSKFKIINPRTVSAVAFYIFSPCLVFTLLTTSPINGDEMTKIVAVTVSTILMLGALVWLIGNALRVERRLLAAVMIAAMFGNAGNYGLSLTLFAFGSDGLAYAGVYFVTTATLINSLGVIIASLGSTNLRGALIGLLKVPSIYAVLLALLANYLRWSPPVPLERAISVLADAAVPTLLILLGIQLHKTQWYRGIQALSLSTGMRLIVSPALAFVFAWLFGLHGTAQQAIITESATPTAVMATVLATEYNIKPAFITTAVFISTLISPLTITPILALLGA
jgi:hypothetical protein